mgnify:CR=1 FL=1
MRKSGFCRRLLTYCAALVVVGIIINSTHQAFAVTKAEDDRAFELINQGYSPYVAMDQVYEEFYNADGLSGTGGIDGLLLDGSPAPNAQCGLGAEMNANPTPAPTAEPTAAPTAEPTAVPTAEPTAAPTAEPTATPTEKSEDFNFLIVGMLVVVGCITGAVLVIKKKNR